MISKEVLKMTARRIALSDEYYSDLIAQFNSAFAFLPSFFDGVINTFTAVYLAGVEHGKILAREEAAEKAASGHDE